MFLNRTLGLVINNSGSEPNEIYNNKFDKLKYAILAQNQNRDKTGVNGLCLKCNDYSDTKYDQAVTHIEGPQSVLWGIATNQGSYGDVTSPAGNTFSLNHNSGESDIYNTGGWINYYYHTTWIPPSLRLYPDWRSSTVEPHAVDIGEYTKTLACPSKLNGGGINPDELKQDLSDQYTQINSLNNQLNTLIDGGNTEEVTNDIYFSIPPEAVELHNDLLSKSPYLSDTVMKSAIQKENVLPNEMIRDILVANPQSAKSENVMNELDNRFIPMPEPMLEEILEGQDSLGSKEILEAKLLTRKIEKSETLNELVLHYKNDTVNLSSGDSVLSLLDGDNSLASAYRLAFEYLAGNDTAMVTNVLNEIPSRFILDEQRQDQYEDYLEYFSVILNLKSQGKNILQITPEHFNQLLELSLEGLEPVQALARNVLIANGLVSYSEPILMPDELKSAPVKKKYKTSQIVSGGSMKLFPNPANHYVIVEYNLENKISGNLPIKISVFSSDGKCIEEKWLKRVKDQVIIETLNYLPGIYICSLYIEKNKTISQKFTIIQ